MTYSIHITAVYDPANRPAGEHGQASPTINRQGDKRHYTAIRAADGTVWASIGGAWTPLYAGTTAADTFTPDA